MKMKKFLSSVLSTTMLMTLGSVAFSSSNSTKISLNGNCLASKNMISEQNILIEDDLYVSEIAAKSKTLKVAGGKTEEENNKKKSSEYSVPKDLGKKISDKGWGMLFESLFLVIGSAIVIGVTQLVKYIVGLCNGNKSSSSSSSY